MNAVHKENHNLLLLSWFTYMILQFHTFCFSVTCLIVSFLFFSYSSVFFRSLFLLILYKPHKDIFFQVILINEANANTTLCSHIFTILCVFFSLVAVVLVRLEFIKNPFGPYP